MGSDRLHLLCSHERPRRDGSVDCGHSFSSSGVQSVAIGSERGLTPMWKRRRTWLLLLAVVGLTLAGLYESVTHVGRGWLRGEAFFQARPTSYWRIGIDEWVVDFESPENSRLV